MPNLDNALRTLKGTPSKALAGKPAAGMLVVLTLACLGLSACGGSSGSSTNAAATAAATTSASGATTTTGASSSKGNRANFRARFGRPGGASPRVRSPVFRQALAKFAVCLRKNGVKVPPPNTSGKGPIFSTKGIKTTSPQFRHASMKCRGVLVSAFRAQRRPNEGAAGAGTAGGAAGAGTAPPAAGQAPGSTGSG